MSGLLPRAAGSVIPINGEGGHVTLAATDALKSRGASCASASATRRPSARCPARGWSTCYEALAELDARPAQPLTPAEVIGARVRRPTHRVQRALELFFAFLGTVAGNLALSLGARGGVYIGGGIVPRLGAIDHSPFRERFEAQG